MEKEKTPLYEFMSLEEILNTVNFDKANRTSFLNMEENQKNGYNKRDFDLLKNRMKKYNNNIFKDGNYVWNVCCPLIIIYVHETSKWYICDGQGRLRCFEEAYKKKKISNKIQIPVLKVFVDTMLEMREHMKAMNTNNCNWNSSDIIHSNAVSLAGDALAIERLIKDYQDILEVQNMFVPSMIILGENGRKKDNIPTSISEINPFCEFEMKFFKKFYDIITIHPSCNKKLKSRIRTSNVALTIHSLFANLFKVCEKNEELYEENAKIILHRLKIYIKNKNYSDVLEFFTGDKNLFKTKIFNFLMEDKTLKENNIVRKTCEYLLGFNKRNIAA